MTDNKRIADWHDRVMRFRRGVILSTDPDRQPLTSGMWLRVMPGTLRRDCESMVAWFMDIESFAREIGLPPKAATEAIQYLRSFTSPEPPADVKGFLPILDRVLHLLSDMETPPRKNSKPQNMSEADWQKMLETRERVRVQWEEKGARNRYAIAAAVRCNRETVTRHLKALGLIPE